MKDHYDSINEHTGVFWGTEYNIFIAFRYNSRSRIVICENVHIDTDEQTDLSYGGKIHENLITMQH